MNQEMVPLLTIAAIAAAVPFIVGLLRIRVAEVVLLIGGGILFGPEVLGLITVDESISLLSELGLGMLFFVAGMELETRAVRGESGRLAAIGWGISLLIAAAVAWRWAAERRGWPLPPRWLRVLVAIAATLAVLGTYRTLNGIEAGTAFLVLLAGAALGAVGLI